MYPVLLSLTRCHPLSRLKCRVTRVGMTPLVKEMSRCVCVWGGILTSVSCCQWNIPAAQLNGSLALNVDAYVSVVSHRSGKIDHFNLSKRKTGLTEEGPYIVKSHRADAPTPPPSVSPSHSLQYRGSLPMRKRATRFTCWRRDVPLLKKHLINVER